MLHKKSCIIYYYFRDASLNYGVFKSSWWEVECCSHVLLLVSQHRCFPSLNQGTFSSDPGVRSLGELKERVSPVKLLQLPVSWWKCAQFNNTSQTMEKQRIWYQKTIAWNGHFCLHAHGIHLSNQVSLCPNLPVPKTWVLFNPKYKHQEWKILFSFLSKLLIPKHSTVS